MNPERIILPALCMAHSHAFQRAMRGQAQRPPNNSSGHPGSFWSWREQMYALAHSLTPETIYDMSRTAYAELRACGVRTVGEFHYVHHQADGMPYADRTILADAVVRAALDEGLRIALLRVAYERGGAGRSVEGVQHRFCDPSVDAVLRDVDTLRAKYANHDRVRIGVAPHSVRAVSREWLESLSAYANEHDLPLHMHVAEQPREIDQCLKESGRRPLELLADIGALTHRFVAVHATHLKLHEAKLLGDARAFACICPTTERDLGDGLPNIKALREAGVKLCVGVDSHVVSDPLEEIRSLETHERLRSLSRVTFNAGSRSPAEQLWLEGSQMGAMACGFSDEGETISLDPDHLELRLTDPEHRLDAIVFGCTKAFLFSHR